jgi:hypothetical protein
VVKKELPSFYFKEADMLGFNYIKVPPSHFVMQYSGGKLARSGRGLAFFYFKPSASIVVIPVGSADVPFIFNEISGDFQALTIQGQLTFRIAAPEKVAGLLNYAVNGAPDKYISEDPQKLPLRLINLVQVLVRAEIQRLPLREAIYASEQVAASVFGKFAASEALTALGVEILSLAIQAIKPHPGDGARPGSGGARGIAAPRRPGHLRPAQCGGGAGAAH